MIFRQTAAISLSVLLLSGSLSPLTANASLLLPAIPNQAGGIQAAQPLLGSVQVPVHPLKVSSTSHSGILETINPLPLIWQANAPLPAMHHSATLSLQPLPLSPLVRLNPPLLPSAQQTSDETRSSAINQPDLTVPQQSSNNRTILGTLAASLPSSLVQFANLTMPRPSTSATDSNYVVLASQLSPLVAPEPQVPNTPALRGKGSVYLAKSSAKSKDIFQMLSLSSLEKLATPPQSGASAQYPAFDFSHGNSGAVQVLQSGLSQNATNIELTTGKAEVIYLSRPATRVSVSNPDAVSAVIISPTQIQLVGKAVGVSSLMVWGSMSSPEHSVVDINVHRDISQLSTQLKYIDPGIQVVAMGAEDTILMTGQAESRETAQLAVEMAKVFMAKMSESASPSGGTSLAPPAKGGGSSASVPGSSISSQAPGSALPGTPANIINLIKIKGEPSTKLELVRQKLHDIDSNIVIDVVPGPDGLEKVILTGRVPSASIASKALNLTSVFYGKPGPKMITAQGGNDFTRLEVSSTSSSSSGDSSATAKSGEEAGAPNVLQGSVMTDATGNVVSMLEIAQKPQIRCSIKFLEVDKNGLNALGSAISGVQGATRFTSWSGNHSPAPGNVISVPSSQSPPGASWQSVNQAANGVASTLRGNGSTWNESYQNGITQVLTIDNKITAAIQALSERRQVRTLAEPTLTMMSGEQGSFLAGGEIPIAFLGGNGQISIEYKEYGIRLNLLPNVTDDGKIQMQVAPEVSSVDQTILVQGVPGFSTRRMNTNLLVEPNQSFVLAGLFKQEDTDSVSQLPGIGSLPIIGSFFRNKWKTHTGSEMIVIIKPEIIYTQTGSTTQFVPLGDSNILHDATRTADNAPPVAPMSTSTTVYADREFDRLKKSP